MLSKAGVLFIAHLNNPDSIDYAQAVNVLYADTVDTPHLFAVYVDDMVTRLHADQRSFIVLYADDIFNICTVFS